MMGKIIFIALLLVFGAAMFMAGMWAPETVRAPVTSGLNRVLPTAVTPVPSDPAAGGGDAGNPGAGQEQSQTQETPPPLYDTLLPPVPLPEKGEYVIQLGLYGLGVATPPLESRVQQMGIKTARIEAVDGHGEHWVVLTGGSFASPAEAQGLRAELAQALNLPPPLPLLLLPPAPPSPPAGS